MKSVGILIFNDVEVLDFAGPFEVFSVSSQIYEYNLFNVFTIAKTKSPVLTINGLSVNPDFDINDAPHIDVLILAGGSGTRAIMEDKDVLKWIRKTHKKTLYTLSICSGARFLAVLGLLNNMPYCTHQGVYENMKELVPNGIPETEKRFVQSGDKIFTSGGISAGIDLSFFIIGKIHGNNVVTEIATYMEYDLIKES